MKSRHFLAAAALWLPLLLTACATARSGAAPQSVVDEFKRTFGNVPVDAVKHSEVQGLYEVHTGGKIIYYAPADDVMIFGELYSITGQSLTQAKIDAALKERTVAIDRSRAITVGEGAEEVVAFLDPDCGYCAAALKWFEERHFASTRMLVFFLNVNPESGAKQRALEFVCSPPELRREAMRKLFKRDASPEQPLGCSEGEEILAAHARIAADTGVTATPVFVVKGETILGFRPDRLASLLQLVPVVSTR